MSVVVEVEIVVRHPDLLGESPAYDAVNHRLLWTDMFVARVRELCWDEAGATSCGRTWEVNELATGVVPRASGGLIVARRVDFVSLSDDGEMDVFASLDCRAGVRLNDAKCDPQGRLVAGMVAEDLSRPGALVRVDGDGAVETILPDVPLPNGLDWSPDGETFYLVDSAALTIDAFAYDASSGRVADQRTIVSVERGTGGPNGMAVDSEGCLWVSITYAGEVRRYSPDGELVDVIQTGARRPTSCAFAGPEGAELFITSGSMKVPDYVPERIGLERDLVEAANQDKMGGALFVCRPGVSGPPATPFAG